MFDLAEVGPWVQEAMSLMSIIGAIGINPFLALGLLGIADDRGLWAIPESLQLLGRPYLWTPLFSLGLFLVAGRSLKITKPFAEAAGGLESLAGVLVVALAVAAAVSPEVLPPPTELTHAGVGWAILWFLSAVSTFVLIVVVRTALGILAWLSPVPFIDAVLEVIKFGLTVILLVLAMVAPYLAIVLMVILLGMAVMAFRWALRVARNALSAIRRRLGSGASPPATPQTVPMEPEG